MCISKEIVLSSRSAKESWLVGLFFKCPNNDDNPNFCQLHCIRKNMDYISFKDYIKNMSDEQIDLIINKHFYGCINSNE